MEMPVQSSVASVPQHYLHGSAQFLTNHYDKSSQHVSNTVLLLQQTGKQILLCFRMYYHYLNSHYKHAVLQCCEQQNGFRP